VAAATTAAVAAGMLPTQSLQLPSNPRDKLTPRVEKAAGQLLQLLLQKQMQRSAAAGSGQQGIPMSHPLVTCRQDGLPQVQPVEVSVLRSEGCDIFFAPYKEAGARTCLYSRGSTSEKIPTLLKDGPARGLYVVNRSADFCFESGGLSFNHTYDVGCKKQHTCRCVKRYMLGVLIGKADINCEGERGEQRRKKQRISAPTPVTPAQSVVVHRELARHGLDQLGPLFDRVDVYPGGMNTPFTFCWCSSLVVWELHKAEAPQTLQDTNPPRKRALCTRPSEQQAAPSQPPPDPAPLLPGSADALPELSAPPEPIRGTSGPDTQKHPEQNYPSQQQQQQQSSTGSAGTSCDELARYIAASEEVHAVVSGSSRLEVQLLKAVFDLSGGRGLQAYTHNLSTCLQELPRHLVLKDMGIPRPGQDAEARLNNMRLAHWVVTPLVACLWDRSLNPPVNPVKECLTEQLRPELQQYCHVLPEQYQVAALQCIRAWLGSDEAFMLLLLSKADASQATPLHLACRYGLTQVVGWLCNHLPDNEELLLAVTRNYWLPVHCALHCKHHQAAATYLAALKHLKLTREELQLCLYQLKNTYFESKGGNTSLWQLCEDLGLPEPLPVPEDDDDKASRGKAVLELCTTYRRKQKVEHLLQSACQGLSQMHIPDDG